MNNNKNLNKLTTLINTNPMVLLYFYGNSCGVCTVVKEMLKKELVNYPNIHLEEIFAEDNMESFANFNIFTLPVILFYVDGKEFLREARNISVRDLFIDIDRIYNLYS